MPLPTAATPADLLADDPTTGATVSSRPLDDVEFEGTARYEVRAEIGRGGMGRVYEVFDRERGLRVALKTRTCRTSHWLVRFKQEFRLVADLHHPNVARLYDLEIERDTCFFTMELVEGTDLLRYVRSEFTDPASTGTSVPTTDASRSRSETPRDLTDDSQSWNEGMDSRLRHALPQLASALQTLHEHGILHRDVKPSNVIVSPEGRVTLLDFGISRTTDELPSASASLEGTPAYMAPEQCREEPAGPAADWYAFGCLMYATLTGRPPYTGASTAILEAKRRGDSIAAPSEVAQGVPADLCALTVELLAPTPSDRPAGTAVLERLRSGPTPSLVAKELFVGRTEELRRLRIMHERSRTGCTFVTVAGPSGMGKTVLLRRFVAKHQRSLVLWGRCHERENVPFRAFDAILDALASVLANVPEAQLEALLPDEACLVEQLFPCFGMVPGVLRRVRRTRRTPAEERLAAFAALREMFERAATIRPLIVVIDDLQWADAESLELLRALLDEPARLRNVTFVATMREAAADDVAAALERALEPLGVDAREVLHLGPLSEVDQRALAAGLDDRVGEAVWSAAGGVPLVLAELVRHTTTQGMAPRSFDEAIGARLASLSPAHRELLLVASTAGRPTPFSALAAVANIDPESREEALAVLRSARLLTTVKPASDPWVDVVHDRLRDSILAADVEAAPTRHRALAHELSSRAAIRRETVALHWLAAGDLDRAADAFEEAGQDALGRLAFEAAAEFFAAALRHGTHEPESAVSLWRRQADALLDAGRTMDAARCYATAGELTSNGEAHRQLAQRHAMALLHGGEYDGGKDAIRRVLREQGVRLPRTIVGTVGGMIGRRLRLELNGYREHPHRLQRANETTRERLALLFDASLSLIATDQLSGSALATDYLQRALNHGDDEQLGFAVALYAILLASEGRLSHRGYLRFCQRLTRLADEAPRPRLQATAELSLGICGFAQGSWESACDRLGRAADVFAADPGTGFERHTARLYQFTSALALGEVALMNDATEGVVAHALRTKSPYEWVSSSVFVAYRCAIANRMEAAEEYQAQAEALVPRKPGIAHLHYFVGGTILGLMRGDADRCVRWVQRWHAPFRRALVFVNPCAKGWFFEYTARGLALTRDADAMAWVARQRGSIDASMEWTAGTSAYIEAVRASIDGDRAACDRHLRRAVERYRRDRMHVWLYPALHRLGTRLGDGEGEAMKLEALQWAAKQGLADPVAWFDCHCPL